MLAKFCTRIQATRAEGSPLQCDGTAAKASSRIKRDDTSGHIGAHSGFPSEWVIAHFLSKLGQHKLASETDRRAPIMGKRPQARRRFGKVLHRKKLAMANGFPLQCDDTAATASSRIKRDAYRGTSLLIGISAGTGR